MGNPSNIADDTIKPLHRTVVDHYSTGVMNDRVNSLAIEMKTGKLIDNIARIVEM